MTNKDASVIIGNIPIEGDDCYTIAEYQEAKAMAIKALETTCIEDYPTCTECEHYDSEKHYCPRFCQVIKDTLAEAQPTDADCISRQKALDCFEQTNTRQGAKYAIETLPSVTPQRPKGKWIVKEETSYSATLECSVCHRRVTFFGGILRATNERVLEEYPYCHCGADMSGGEEDGKDSAFD